MRPTNSLLRRIANVQKKPPEKNSLEESDGEKLTRELNLDWIVLLIPSPGEKSRSERPPPPPIATREIRDDRHGSHHGRHRGRGGAPSLPNPRSTWQSGCNTEEKIYKKTSIERQTTKGSSSPTVKDIWRERNTLIVYRATGTFVLEYSYVRIYLSQTTYLRSISLKQNYFQYKMLHVMIFGLMTNP